jgi:hypothetical protein
MGFNLAFKGLGDKQHSITAQNEQYLKENIENIVLPVSPPGL